MPKRDDIKSILIIGAGPIIIGQACEFDYSGTQAARALKEEGYKIILVNSNPATIMTDPEFADRTYIEPITAEICEAIIKAERPQASKTDSDLWRRWRPCRSRGCILPETETALCRCRNGRRRKEEAEAGSDKGA